MLRYAFVTERVSLLAIYSSADVPNHETTRSGTSQRAT